MFSIQIHYTSYGAVNVFVESLLQVIYFVLIKENHNVKSSSMNMLCIFYLWNEVEKLYQIYRLLIVGWFHINWCFQR